MVSQGLVTPWLPFTAERRFAELSCNMGFTERSSSLSEAPVSSPRLGEGVGSFSLESKEKKFSLWFSVSWTSLSLRALQALSPSASAHWRLCVCVCVQHSAHRSWTQH